LETLETVKADLRRRFGFKRSGFRALEASAVETVEALERKAKPGRQPIGKTERKPERYAVKLRLCGFGRENAGDSLE
jgi:hypothetical protein